MGNITLYYEISLDKDIEIFQKSIKRLQYPEQSSNDTFAYLLSTH